MAIAQTRFTRGETFTAVLKIRSGDLSSATCQMVMKLAVNGKPPGDAAPAAAVLDVVYRPVLDPDDATTPAAFVGTLSAGASEGLTAGVLYAMDARLSLGGTIVQTDTVRVSVEERVTEDDNG